MGLIEVDGCVYDEQQLRRSHGFESLDAVGREAFVNHVHLTGDDRHDQANRLMALWMDQMRTNWPGRVFRMYRQEEGTELVLRFHMVRPGAPNWCETSVDIFVVAGG